MPGQWRELQDELRRMGRTLDNVRALLLTHGDTDHVGFAARLQRERGGLRVPPVRELQTVQADVQARWVLPGHGPAWGDGTAQAVSRYRSAAAA